MSEPVIFITQRLGPEWDRELFSRLVNAIGSAGGTIHPVYTGTAGTQEIVVHEIDIAGRLLTATSETSVGLLLNGPEELVRTLVDKV